MFFYVAYIGLVAPARWLRVMSVVAPIALAVALPTLHGCFLPSDNPASSAGSAKCAAYMISFPPTRLIEFLAGVALYHLKPRIPQILGLAAALGVLGGYLPTIPGLDGNSLAANVVRQAEVVLGGGALIASLSRPGWLSNLLSFRPLIIGGEISYAMYMTHQVGRELRGSSPRTQLGPCLYLHPGDQHNGRHLSRALHPLLKSRSVMLSKCGFDVGCQSALRRSRRRSSSSQSVTSW